MSKVAQSVSYPPSTLKTQHGDKMETKAVVEAAVPEEIARQKAAAEWTALVAECAARGDE